MSVDYKAKLAVGMQIPPEILVELSDEQYEELVDSEYYISANTYDYMNTHAILGKVYASANEGKSTPLEDHFIVDKNVIDEIKKMAEKLRIKDAELKWFIICEVS